MLRVEFLCSEMTATRRYTQRVLAHTDPARWFEMPKGAEGPLTHIAWQVGHLVYAQYAHFMLMICGETPADAGVIPKARYFELFAKGSVPQADHTRYPPPAELRQYFDALHAHCLARFARFPEELLDQPTLHPHQIAVTRLDMAMWWIKHEMLHTGQIALLRRLLGEKPWR